MSRTNCHSPKDIQAIEVRLSLIYDLNLYFIVCTFLVLNLYASVFLFQRRNWKTLLYNLLLLLSVRKKGELR